MYPYNKRFIKLIRKELKLTQQEMSNLLGISLRCFATYESGRSKGSKFFHERMIQLFGIDLQQPEYLHKIVFKDPGRIASPSFLRLSGLEIFPEQQS